MGATAFPDEARLEGIGFGQVTNNVDLWFNMSFR